MKTARLADAGGLSDSGQWQVCGLPERQGGHEHNCVSGDLLHEKGSRVFTPDLMKSEMLRVTTVSSCSRPVAAIRPSTAGKGWVGERRPQRSAILAVIGNIRTA